MHSLDATEFDVACGGRPADPRLGTGGIESCNDVGHVGNDLSATHNHHVMIAAVQPVTTASTALMLACSSVPSSVITVPANDDNHS